MALPRTCVRCGQGSNGLLFCGDCAPTETISQSATIKMTSPIGVMIRDGEVEVTPGTGVTEVRAKERPDPERKPQRSATSKEEWNRDRQRIELHTTYIDSGDNLYLEIWQDTDTGETAYVREGALNDQNHHGPRTRKAQSERRDGLT